MEAFHKKYRLNKNKTRSTGCNSSLRSDVRKALAGISPHLNILALNDDCLEAIIRLLNANDQVNFASCAFRLKCTFKHNARWEYNVLQTEICKDLSLSNHPLFFEMAGPFIKQIVGLTPSEQVLELIGIHCKNLRCIQFTDYKTYDRFYLNKHTLKSLLGNTHLLTQLKLECAYLEDNVIPVLSNLDCLKVLSLAYNTDLTGRYIAALNHLEHLSLNNCHGIRSKFFKEICERVTSLKTLDIERCCAVMTADLRVMLGHLGGLETLKLCVHNIADDFLADIESLKHLHLQRHAGPSIQDVNDLSFHQHVELELLEIKGFHCNNQIINFPIGKISNLKVLRYYHCKGLDDNCLELLSKLLNLREISVKNCCGFSEASLINLITTCSHLATLNVKGCRQLTQQFFQVIFSLFVSERKQGNHSRHTNIKTSQTHYLAFSLDILRCETDGILTERIFEYEKE